MYKRQHYYNARHSKLVEMGLKPHLLSESLLDSLLNIAVRYGDRIDRSLFVPKVNWRNARNERRPKTMAQGADGSAFEASFGASAVAAKGNGHFDQGD